MNYIPGDINKLINDLALHLEEHNKPVTIITIMFKKPTESKLKDRTFAFGTASSDDGEAGIIVLEVNLDGTYGPLQVVFESIKSGKLEINVLDKERYVEIDDTLLLLTTLDSYINDHTNPDLRFIKGLSTDPETKRVLH